ncbi:MAG TPA: TetR/AcrR family transcriptional regulator [Erysipelothrix sp.]|nr:TetR/AcrR family transcriptional regulator [Erysipelothrix sp.]
MNKSNKQQYNETHTKIQEAYLDLTQHCKHVSITQLCNTININRSSFYYHFDDIVALHNAIKKRIFKEVHEDFLRSKKSDYFFTLTNFRIFTHHLFKYRKFYTLFLNENATSFPIEDGYITLKEQIITPYMHQKGITDERCIHLRFICFQAGLTLTLKDWFENGLMESPDCVAQILYDVLKL